MQRRWYILLVLICFLTSIPAKAQADLDRIIKSIDYEEDTLKAIYKYVATAVSYDTKFKDAPLEYHSYDEVLADVLKKGQGVCMHYAALFHALCKQLGYKSYIISGYTKFMNQAPGKVPHAWNAVFSNGEWKLYDVTWGSGYVIGETFYSRYDEMWFQRDPEEFIYSHIPFDPIWQLRKNPASHSEIAKGIYYGDNIQFDRDEIFSYEGLSEKQQMEQTLVRIKRSGVTNELIKNKVDYLESQIAALQHNEQVYAYHDGVKLLQNARKEYSLYLAAKQKKFRKYSEEDISRSISGVTAKATKAYSYFKAISVSNQQLKKSVEENIYQAQNLLKEAANEEQFLNKYLNAWKPLRKFAF